MPRTIIYHNPSSNSLTHPYLANPIYGSRRMYPNGCIGYKRVVTVSMRAAHRRRRLFLPILLCKNTYNISPRSSIPCPKIGVNPFVPTHFRYPRIPPTRGVGGLYPSVQCTYRLNSPYRLTHPGRVMYNTDQHVNPSESGDACVACGAPIHMVGGDIGKPLAAIHTSSHGGSTRCWECPPYTNGIQLKLVAHTTHVMN